MSPKSSFTRRHFLSLMGATALFGAASQLIPFSHAANLDDSRLNDPIVAQKMDEVEAFFKSLTTVQGRFIQANPNGSFLEGDMYMHRPGRMRFEYDEPTPFLLVADGSFFIHVDKQLEQVTHIPLGATPAKFLLSDELSIRDGLTLSGFYRNNGLLRMQFHQTDEPDLGSMIFTFTEDPIMLKQWTTIDAQQSKTTITLIAPTMGDELDPELFIFRDPWARNRGKGDN